MSDAVMADAASSLVPSNIEAFLQQAVALPAGRKELAEALSQHPALLAGAVAAMTDRNSVRRLFRNPGVLLPIKLGYTRPPQPFGTLPRANVGLHRLCTEYSFNTVLDVGAGAGEHARILHDLGKKVTKLDLGVSIYAQRSEEDGIASVIADANTVEFDEKFDCVWASHVLEHQPNVGSFIGRLRSWTREGGILAVTVPPAKFELAGGHLTLWTPASLLYNFVIAGIDCSDAALLHYGYNITAIIRNRSIPLPDLHYDHGDIGRLAAFFPKNFREGIDGFSVATPCRGPAV